MPKVRSSFLEAMSPQQTQIPSSQQKPKKINPKLLQTELKAARTVGDIFTLWDTYSHTFDAIHLNFVFEKLGTLQFYYYVHTYASAVQKMCERFVVCMRDKNFPSQKAFYAPLALSKLDCPTTRKSWFEVFQGLVTKDKKQLKKMGNETISNIAASCFKHKLGSQYFIADLAREFVKRDTVSRKTGAVFAKYILEHNKYNKDHDRTLDQQLHAHLLKASVAKARVVKPPAEKTPTEKPAVKEKPIPVCLASAHTSTATSTVIIESEVIKKGCSVEPLDSLADFPDIDLFVD